MNKNPNLIAEAVMVCVKYFLAFLVLNNLFWATMYFKPSITRQGAPKVEITQNGNRDINQTITNG